ncbi:hypothetical protein SPRG_03154 [Saprolegnia parasitica CBS 223.65]|uniref:GH18 domain-containing protein n=1 Tax=Saprolegnia parasitica (strain CBS 223.65) TaxID=695850 RepID=A0A067CN47_SAPPC|nr:hypothetical protein SPRG_03154 [Saprolegnia parasitica CBS 223.65]KDO31938.1 hypothetical protein SPRG_03154 [Saprolegnia parasitica CBS 223.65]|eukprot:XP_012197136.1 hypothetical protein SPRG_03154 [Saprolegnia parasitica CBS 223.65]
MTTPRAEFARLASPQHPGRAPQLDDDDIAELPPRESEVTLSCLRRAALPVLAMIGLIVGILAAVGTFSPDTNQSVSTGSDAQTTPTPTVTMTAKPTPITKASPSPTSADGTCPNRGTHLVGSSCVSCPTPKKTFAVFWESQVDCSSFASSSAAAYVTHIYWSFALIDAASGAVSSSFQGSDATLKACLAQTRAKCIKNFISIGGATMRETFAALNSTAQIATFASSAALVVQKFGFDGVDIDDESGNLLAAGDWKANAAPSVVTYLTALKTQLGSLPRAAGEPAYEITWDEFPTSLNPDCNTPTGDFQRCFDPAIARIVDHVNLMMYNAASATDYDTYLTTTTPTLWAKTVNPSQIILGGCVGPVGTLGGCAFGAAPTSTQLAAYASQGAAQYGGAMLWTASADMTTNQGATVTAMGKAGSYSNSG